MASNGYVDLLLPDHPRARSNGYVAEHIIVWEEVNGKPLPKGWHVHHLNGVKDDNRSENLQGMPSREHMSYIAAQSAAIKKRDDEIARLKARIEKLEG